MNAKWLATLFTLSLLVSCAEVKQEQIATEPHAETVRDLLGFFHEHAFQAELGTYYSEVNNQGEVISGKIFNVALSRLIYGLSYAASIDSSYLVQAQQAAAFQLDKLVDEDSLASHFVSFFDATSDRADASSSFDIWQQAYGLCGLSELYRQTRDQELLSKIHRHHEGFVKRFHDDVHGGFYGNYENNRQVSGSKTLQSLIYPVTAYMENLWSVDSLNREKYEPYLKENIQLAYEQGWNAALGWVNVKFDDQWKPCDHISPDSACFLVTPGHNFQLASVFLRAVNWDFLTAAEKQRYQARGIEILEVTLTKPIFPSRDLSEGFFSEVNPVNNEVLDKRKTWWQHCEALLAMSLAEDRFETELENLKGFYFRTFPDEEHGGEYFYVDENNVPLSEELKGSIGKSAYHTIEMIRFLNQ